MSLDDEKVADLLMRKYTLLKQEVWQYTGYYKAHIRNTQILGGALLGGAGYALAKGSPPFSFQDWWWAWWAFGCLLPMATMYLVLDIVGAHYNSILLGERMAILEEEINALAGRRLLIWETSAAPAFYTKLRPMPGVVNPEWLMSAPGVLLVALGTIIIPALVLVPLWATHQGSWIRMIATTAMALICIETTIVTLYAAFAVVVGMRGKPRLLFRKLMMEPLRSANRDDRGSALIDHN